MDNFYIKDSDEDEIQIQALLSEYLQINPDIIRGGGEYKPPHNYEEFKEAADTIKKNAKELREEIWEVRKRINDLRSFLLQYDLSEDYNKETEIDMYIVYGSLVDYSNFIDEVFSNYPKTEE